MEPNETNPLHAVPWIDRIGEFEQRHEDYRHSFEIDYARIIHCAAFRRLQGKTQVLGLGESDFYRTRLTHSIEVAQIATGLVNYHHRVIKDPEGTILPPTSIITAIALAHDIGHPPFGHGGEIALQYIMERRGGFEGNAQTLRILSRLEKRTAANGLDLSRRTLLGVLKYPVAYSKLLREKRGGYESVKYLGDESDLGSGEAKFRQVERERNKPPKCYYDEEEEIVSWILDRFSAEDRDHFQSSAAAADKSKHGKSIHKGFDTSIMDLADDISYGIHDLEDSVHMKLLEREEFDFAISSALKEAGPEWLKGYNLDNLSDRLFGETSAQRKSSIGALINAVISSTSIIKKDDFQHELLSHKLVLNSPAFGLLQALQDLVYSNVIRATEVQTLEYRGQQIVMELFEAFEADPDRLLPTDTKEKLDRAAAPKEQVRVICDHLAGMTDQYAARMYERMFLPRQGSLFQKL